MLRAVATISLAVLLAASPAIGPAQVVFGAGVLYGPVVVPAPYAPVVVVPYPLYGYGGAGYGYGGAGYGYGGAGYVYPPPRSDGLPSCYRAGRCTLADLYSLGGRPDRLDRLAPTAPDPPSAGRAFDLPANVPPTAENEIQPQYRGASVPRDEFRESGTAR